jgi:hypothetical protein
LTSSEDEEESSAGDLVKNTGESDEDEEDDDKEPAMSPKSVVCRLFSSLQQTVLILATGVQEVKQ